MIDRQNWKDTKDFLSYHAGLRSCESTIKRSRIALRTLLEWADSRSFGDARSIDPTFMLYLSRKKTTIGNNLSSVSGEKTLSIAKMFFSYARSEWPARYKNISESWIQTLQLSKRNSSHSRLKDHRHYSLEDILKIAALPTPTLQDKRDVAAVCFLYLSGMRIGAFTSIPIECVDLKSNDIYQLPEKGVMTKNKKAAITHLLQIPEILKVVSEWDSLVRSQLSLSDLWYPVMKRDGDRFDAGKVATVTMHRGCKFSKRLRVLCERAGVVYLSPHKIRHGHVVYGMKNARDLAGLKSVSQNVMHNSIQITDAIYGGFSNDDVRNTIASIGMTKSEPANGAQVDLKKMEAILSNPKAMALIEMLIQAQQ